MVKGIVIWAAISTAAMLLAGFLAGVKNRDYSFWMAWAFIIPPSIIILMLLPRRAGPRPQRPPADDLHHEDAVP